jgi:hypothetical protein
MGVFMSPLELKKLQVELLRVSAAKAEMELRIAERLEEIQRLEDNIKISEAKETELQEKITAAKQ